MQRLHTQAAVLKDPSLQHPWGESWGWGLQTSILWCRALLLSFISNALTV